MSDDNKSAPKKPVDGKVRTRHCKFTMVKECDIKKNDGTTYEGFKIFFEDLDPKFGGDKTMNLHTKVLNQAWHAESKKNLLALEADDDFTIVETAKDGWYNLTEIVPGHIGKAGSVLPGQGGGQGSGSYDNAGAHAGNLVNNSIALLIAEGAKDIAAGAIVEKAKLVEEASKRIKSEVIGAAAAPASNGASAAEGDDNPDSSDDEEKAAAGDSPI